MLFSSSGFSAQVAFPFLLLLRVRSTGPSAREAGRGAPAVGAASQSGLLCGPLSGAGLRVLTRRKQATA